MKNEEITAYKTPDGEIFEDEDKANKHFSDLLGEELDGLMRLSKSSPVVKVETESFVGILLNASTI